MHNASDVGKGAPGPRTRDGRQLVLKVEEADERCKNLEENVSGA